MGLISRVSSRTYRKMFFLRQVRRSLQTSLTRKGEAPYSVGFRVGPSDNPSFQRVLNVFICFLGAGMYHKIYHGTFETLNHGRGYVHPHSLTNEQLGLPSQIELIRMSNELKFGKQEAPADGDAE